MAEEENLRVHHMESQLNKEAQKLLTFQYALQSYWLLDAGLMPLASQTFL